MKEMQQTIAKPVSLKGTGLHTGIEVTVTFKPAPVNYGYKFIRTDIENHPVIEADVDYVKDTERGTNLVKNGIRISTTEHMLAAIFGLGIDNLIIELNGIEIPILDGSSRLWIDLLKEAGIATQEAEREVFEIKKPIRYYNPETKSELIAIPSDELRYSVMIQFNTRVLDTQFAALNHIQDFETEVGNCRTFVFLHELEYLIQNNLIKGGDLNNAIVFVDRVLTQDELDRLSSHFDKPRVEVVEEGILNNLRLHHLNEPARHKLVDVMGDMALLGHRVKAHIIATRPGHTANVEFTRMLKAHIGKASIASPLSRFDLNKPPVFDINAIKNLLPHRPPFLLVDKILEVTADGVVGLKNVTMNEAFFVGHFPEEPVMPGVLQIEAMAQTGGILILSSVPDPENYITYFMKVDQVKFRQKVVPGDTLIFELKLVSPIRRGLCHMRGTAWVGDKVVMEAEMLAQIARKPQA